MDKYYGENGLEYLSNNEKQHEDFILFFSP